MPDSTVQVCAYWQAGDRYDFDYNESKYTVRAGDTTRIHTLYERRTIEVVSATRDTYLLEITYGDYRHSDPEAQRIHDLCLRTAGQLPPLRVETDQTGSFRRIVNLDEWSDLMRRIVRPVSDMLWEESSEEVRKALPRGKFRKLMERQLADPETLGRSCREELGRLLYFHGVRFPIVEEMAGEEAFLPLTGGEAVQAQTRFWLDEELSDE